MAPRILLACDTLPVNPWNRDRLPAIRQAAERLDLSVMDVYEFHSLEEAHRIHQVKGGTYFTQGEMDLGQLNERFYRRVIEHRCDILILATVDNYAWYLLPETVARLRGQGVFVAGFLGDDEFTWERNRLYVPMFDRVVAYSRSHVDRYNAIRKDCCYWLPNSCYFEERSFDALQLPESEKEFDVILFGSPFGGRPDFVRGLMRERLKVGLFGPESWNAYDDLRPIYRGYIPWQDIGNRVRRSRIVLASLENHIDGSPHMNTKIWDAVKNGQMCVVTRYPPLTEDYGLVEGREIVMYDSAEDLAHKARYYVDNPGERMEIARRLFERVEEQFDYVSRYRDLFAYLIGAATTGGSEAPEPSLPRVTVIDLSTEGGTHDGFACLRIAPGWGWKRRLREAFRVKVTTPYVILTHGGFRYSRYLDTLLEAFPDLPEGGRAVLLTPQAASAARTGPYVDMGTVLWRRDVFHRECLETGDMGRLVRRRGPMTTFGNLRLLAAVGSAGRTRGR